MLRALYDYAIRKQLTLPPGYVKKTVKAWIDLSSISADYLGLWMGDGTEIPCPDIGSFANSKDKSNVLVEKRTIVLPEEETPKSRFFREALRSAAAYERKAAICAEALEDPERVEKIRKLLDEHKIKPSDRVSFRVDGYYLVSTERIAAWWTEYRKQFQKENRERTRCLITGDLTVPMNTTPSVSGLRVVGGHASGDALICFDKNAFTSYGLKQAANAPVSEEAFAAVKAALDELRKALWMLFRLGRRRTGGFTGTFSSSA